MSKLIQLRQRIRAIETIKKITHAMRLIAMSTHSQLKGLQEPTESYTAQIATIVNELMAKVGPSDSSLLNPDPAISQKTLAIIIGSQKGLCGSFNTTLFKSFNQTIIARAFNNQNLDIIAVGQKAIDYAQTIPHAAIIGRYEKCSSATLSAVAQRITNQISQAVPHYRSVIIVANEFKTFFNQIPKVTELIPFASKPLSASMLNDDILWEQKPADIAAALIPQYLHAQINFHLFQSLYAEHAARFVSMDAATRNAKKLLEHAKLDYNKLRQAKITKELTELSGSYS